MATHVKSNDLGTQLIKVLGLPKHLTKLSIHLVAGEAVKVDCTFYPEFDNKAFIDLFQDIMSEELKTEKKSYRLARRLDV